MFHEDEISGVAGLGLAPAYTLPGAQSKITDMPKTTEVAKPSGDSWGKTIATILDSGTKATETVLKIREDLKGNKKAPTVIRYESPSTDWKKIALIGGVALLVLGGGFFALRRKK
jgi:LPXTG-motif cell wall-anchored protein